MWSRTELDTEASDDLALQVPKFGEGEDIHKYAATVDRICNTFSYELLKEDQFRCLVFIQGLHNNPDIMLHNLVDEYNNPQRLIVDSNMDKRNGTQACLIKKPEIDRSTENNPMTQPQTQQTYPNNSNYEAGYRFCGDFYLYKDYPLFKNQCQDCNSYRHKEGFCQSSKRRPYPSYKRGPYLAQHCQEHSILTTMQLEKTLFNVTKLDKALTSLDRRIKLMAEHKNEISKTVRDVTAQYQIISDNCLSEDHLLTLCNNEVSNIKRDIKQKKAQSNNVKEKVFAIERMNIRNIQETLQIETTQLEDLMNFALQKCDDTYAIKCYQHTDESVVKELFMKIQNLSKEKINIKSKLDRLVIEGDVMKSQMERLGKEAGNDNAERTEALNQWQKTVNRSENRSDEIESLLQLYEELDQQIDENSINKKEQSHFLASSIKDTAEYRIKLEDSEKRLKVLKDESVIAVDEMKITKSELKALNNITVRSSLNLRSLRLVIKESKSANSTKFDQINKTLENIEKLRMKLKDVQESKLSVDQLVTETEFLLQEEGRHANKLIKHIENLSRRRFHISQEKQTANDNKLKTESMIKSYKNNIKILENEISKMEEKVMQQDRIFYGQDFKIIQIENRISNKEMDTSNPEELTAFQEKLNKLSAELEGLETLYRKLSRELKNSETESTQMERVLANLSNKKKSLDIQRDNDELYIDLTEKALVDLKNERNRILVDKFMLQLKMQRIDKKVEFFDEKVFNLEKYRLDIENCIKKRELDINIAMEILKMKIHLANEEKSRLKKEINFKKLKADMLMNRYEIELLKMNKSEDEETDNQTYHIIKVMQEIDDLRIYGNKLNAEIEQSKCELEALQNTLSLVKESNRLYEYNYKEADSELVEERNGLEQICKNWKKDIQEKKRNYISLATASQKKHLACETADDDLREAAMLKMELEGNKTKWEKDISLLKERIIRANKSLQKAKSAAIKQFLSIAGIDDGEIRDDIELRLMKDLLEKVAALLMSQVKSARVNQKTMEIKAKAYLRAADIITSPGSSIGNSGVISSGASSARASVCSATATAFLASPASSRSQGPQRVMNLSELVILPGESNSGKTSNLSSTEERDRDRSELLFQSNEKCGREAFHEEVLSRLDEEKKSIE
ncbi:hypothetical protein ACTXT7_006268 [Hymenolepis weldensis]